LDFFAAKRLNDKWYVYFNERGTIPENYKFEKGENFPLLVVFDGVPIIDWICRFSNTAVVCVASPKIYSVQPFKNTSIKVRIFFL
jgi:hypothetical protein